MQTTLESILLAHPTSTLSPRSARTVIAVAKATPVSVLFRSACETLTSRLVDCRFTTYNPTSHGCFLVYNYFYPFPGAFEATFRGLTCAESQDAGERPLLSSSARIERADTIHRQSWAFPRRNAAMSIARIDARLSSLFLLSGRLCDSKFDDVSNHPYAI